MAGRPSTRDSRASRSPASSRVFGGFSWSLLPERHWGSKRLGVPLSGWMVGDGLESDVAAGRAAGLRTAWVCVAGHSVSSADLTVPDVATFAAYLLSR